MKHEVTSICSTLPILHPYLEIASVLIGNYRTKGRNARLYEGNKGKRKGSEARIAHRALRGKGIQDFNHPSSGQGANTHCQALSGIALIVSNGEGIQPHDQAPKID